MQFPGFWVTVVCLVLGSVPLLVYPFVLLADVMSLAAERSGKQPFLLTVVSRSFQVGSLLHPLVYVPCLALSTSRRTAHRQRIAAVISAIPIGFVILLALLFWAWSACEKRRPIPDPRGIDISCT